MMKLFVKYFNWKGTGNENFQLKILIIKVEYFFIILLLRYFKNNSNVVTMSVYFCVVVYLIRK